MSSVIKGQRVRIQSPYQGRAFQLQQGEVLPDDPEAFDRKAHAPKLIQLAKGDAFTALTRSSGNGEVFVGIERDGHTYACLLLSNSFALL